jgi:Serine kinase of the HPr protein, regulates carbohydrate metabolism
MDSKNRDGTQGISVASFVASSPEDLTLEVLVGHGGLASRNITSTRLQKLGLALAGFPNYIHPGRIQMIGQSEIAFLKQMTAKERATAINRIAPQLISCIILVKSLDPPDEIAAFAVKNDIPLLRTPLVSSHAIGAVTDHLQELLAPETVIHGVLMEMHGIGVLITGDSGIGKSECALDLVTRGHRLVADDAVQLRRIGKRLKGCSPKLTSGYLELHGLGIINVRDLFGVSSVCETVDLELCIELHKWDKIDHIERLGLEMQTREIFDIPTPLFALPVSSGRNISTLVETAVRVFLLRNSGNDPTQELLTRHTAIMSAGHKASI